MERATGEVKMEIKDVSIWKGRQLGSSPAFDQSQAHRIVWRKKR
jgi:hypothetical protein